MINLPAAFTERMKQMLGREYDAFIASYDKERSQGLRVNGLKTDPAEFAKTAPFSLNPVAWAAEGFAYGAEDRPGRHPYHDAGVYYIQEPSAMIAASLLNPQPGEMILDLCAAPGGKSTQAAARLGGEGLLVSNEIHPARAKILSQNIERMGIRNAVVTNEDSGRLTKYFPAFFDGIIVDAPCSGEGMFRKDETAVTEWSPENVRRCAGRQQEILENAAMMLKPGGRLVYSTCTFAPEEDEQAIGQLDWKLRNDPRVVCMEKTNIRYVLPENLEGPADFSSIDVSFISLTKVLLPVRNLLTEGGEIVCLIKPQFEAGREKVGKKGVVRDPAVHREVIEKVRDYAMSIFTQTQTFRFVPVLPADGLPAEPCRTEKLPFRCILRRQER